MKKLILFILLWTSPVWGATFTWDSNTEPDLAGYRIYYEGTQLYDISATNNSVTVSDVLKGSYTITAYDTEDFESEHSEPLIVAAYYYNSLRYEYNGLGQIIYKGEHTEEDAAEGDTNWVITKYYYTNNMMIRARVRITSWTNRAVGW